MIARLILLFSMMVIGAFPCWAGPDPVSVAKKYVDALQNNSKQAFAMLTPRAAKMGQQQFDQFARFFMGKGMSGLTGIEIGTVLFSKNTQTHALIIFAKKLKLSGPKTAEMTGKLEKGRDEDFPANQLAAAKKIIKLDGQTWIQPLPIYLELAAGSWQVDAKGENFPFKEFRGDLKKKFGANLLRYAGEDSGDPGCPTTKSKDSTCYLGEDDSATNSSGTSSKTSGCVLLESNKPCGPEETCYFTEGDNPVPCNKGQDNCVTFEGNACAIR